MGPSPRLSMALPGVKIEDPNKSEDGEENGEEHGEEEAH